MYKLTVTSSQDGIKRTFGRTHKSGILSFRDEGTQFVEPEIFNSHDWIYEDADVMTAIVREALDHGDAAQLEPIEVEA